MFFFERFLVRILWEAARDLVQWSPRFVLSSREAGHSAGKLVVEAVPCSETCLGVLASSMRRRRLNMSCEDVVVRTGKRGPPGQEFEQDDTDGVESGPPIEGFLPRACSGAMYLMVPMTEPLKVGVCSSSTTLAIPRSSKQFSGLTSRWMTPTL